MTKSSKLVFFGNERLVSGLEHTDAPILRGLIAAGYEIVAIVSHHSDAKSRKARPLEVAAIAEEYGISLLLPNRPGDIEQELRDLRADAAILVAYGKIIPQRIINVFAPIGIINIHPSLLPRHRGPTPIETTILKGDSEAGISIMQLTAGMDEGPVYAQTRISLRGDESKQELYDTLSRISSEQLLAVLPSILSGELSSVPQENSDVTYTSLLTKQDGNIDPLTDEARAIERKVRAYRNFPKTRLKLLNNDVIITSVKIVDTADNSKLVIPCANNTYLEVCELVGPSGKTMSGDAYLRGYGRP